MAALSSNSPPDAEAVAWMERVAKRDAAALEALYARFGGAVFGLLQRMLTSSEAEEALQDVFVRVWNNAGKYDSRKSAPVSWIMTIARNRARDQLRKRIRRPATVSINAEDGEQNVSGEDDSSIEWNFPHGSMTNILQGPLARLPQNQREAIELSFLEGWTHAEVAEKLGRPLGSVKSDIRRGLIQLRQWFEDND